MTVLELAIVVCFVVRNILNSAGVEPGNGVRLRQNRRIRSACLKNEPHIAFRTVEHLSQVALPKS